MSLPRLRAPLAAPPEGRSPTRPFEPFLMRAQASSMLAVERRFCRTPSCEVVYYGENGHVVAKRDVPVRVGLKEREDPIPLCYCFGFSRADVRDEIASGGQCTIRRGSPPGSVPDAAPARSKIPRAPAAWAT
jgi:hypothetical protein